MPGQPQTVPGATRSIFIMDFWSDHNRGDAAMQVALLGMLKAHFPTAKLTVSTEYGTNQDADIPGELDHVLKIVPQEAVCGGIRHTAYPIGSAARRSRLAILARKLWFTAESVLALALIFLFRRHAGLFFGKRRRAAFDALASCDLVVWNGRNFRSRSARTEVYELWSLIYNPLVAHLLGRPVVAIGASCWTLSTAAGRRMVSRTLAKCRYVSAREDATFAYLREILPASRFARIVRRRPDLSFGYLKDHLRPLTFVADKHLTLAMTIVEWGESDKAAQDDYVQALAGAVIAIAKEHTLAIRVVPQVPYGPQGYGAILTAFRAAVSGHVEGFEVIDRKLSLDELCEHYAACDLLIGTRMHSVIFSWCSGTPAIGIAYDAGAKWAILDDLGVGRFITPIGTVSAGAVVNAFEGLKTLDLALVMDRIAVAVADVERNVEDWADSASYEVQSV